VKVRRIVQRHIRRDADGIQVAADVQAVLAVNVDEGEDPQSPQRETAREGSTAGKDAQVKAGREREEHDHG
jgi:hypothetical protein